MDTSNPSSITRKEWLEIAHEAYNHFCFNLGMIPEPWDHFLPLEQEAWLAVVLLVAEKTLDRTFLQIGI